MAKIFIKNTLNQLNKTKMDLNRLAIDIHQANKDKGFWDGERNISEVLFLIITEMAEGIEGHRKGKFADLKNFSETHKVGGFCKSSFELNIKDSFEDEVADSIIRALDLCGFYEISYFPQGTKENFGNNVGENLMNITSLIVSCNLYLNESDIVNVKELLRRTVTVLIAFSKYYQIDIEKHIKYKLQYNATRPRLHGKSY